MKKKILLIIIFTTILSCKKENSKSDFLGNWSSTSDTNFDINIKFSIDSIFIENPLFFSEPNHSTKWKVFDEKIIHDGSVWDFKFNKKKDTLWLKFATDSIYHLVFRKIKNNFEYLENRIGLELSLPKTSKKLTEIENKELAFNIYLGKKNDSIIVRTDNNLKSIDEIIYRRAIFNRSKIERNINAKRLERSFEIDTLMIVLLTDKSVNNKELDSIKTLLKKIKIKIFFRIYDSEEYVKNDWKAEINWLGIHEK